MRWATYATDDGGERVGVIQDDAIFGLPAGETLLDLLRAGALPISAERARHAPTEIVPLESARLLAPIPVPPSIRDFMSFENHVVTSMAAIGSTVDPIWYRQPTFYFTNPAAVVGPHADIPIAPGSGQFDFELEVAAVIGRRVSDLTLAEAEDCIAGFTILCDWSARDLQADEMRVGLGPAKGKDTATSLGPWLVTPDELQSARTAQGYDLGMSVRVNGIPYSSGTWASLHWTFAQMLVYASRGTELRPGDVIGSGTVGTGCILELARVHGSAAYPWLHAGDVVEIEVERLGRQVGRIVAGPAVNPLT